MIGWARGGRLEALVRPPLRGVPLLAASAGMALLVLAPPLPPTVARVLHGACYLVALAAVWQNRRHPWSLPILVGLGLNTAVIWLNGGWMPVAPDALARFPQAGGAAGAPAGLDARHVIAGPGTRLTALGDTIAIGLGRAGLIASPGDVLMAVGLGGFVQGRMAQARAGPRNAGSNV